LLGHAFDDEAIAEPQERARARQLVESLGDGDVDSTSRVRLLEQLAAIPSARLALALETEEGGRCLVVVENGQVMWREITDSRDPDRAAVPEGKRSPTVFLREMADEDRVAALFREASEEWTDAEADGQATVPYAYRSVEAMLEALARLQPVLREEAVSLVVEVNAQRYEVSLAPDEVVARPLFGRGPDRSTTARFCELTGLKGAAIARRPILVDSHPAGPRPFRPDARYVTGTARERLSALFDDDRAGSLDAATLARAVRDPANADTRYVEVRRKIYGLLGKVDGAPTREAFQRALRHDTDDAVQSVTYLLWRFPDLLEDAPATIVGALEAGDELLAERLKSALAQAEVPPPREWVESLPPALRARAVWRVE
jgi:hypothetical protein